MSNGCVVFSAIKRLLFKYGLEFKSGSEYERFMGELIDILNI